MTPAAPSRPSHAPTPLHAVLEGSAPIKIEPGGYFVSRKPEHVLVTVLGSCIAACLHDPKAGIGGMNHFMLPSSARGEWAGASSSMRYGNFAMERLINDILRGGGRRERLQAKLFGGAAMIRGSEIGLRNADFVEDYLQLEGIEIVAADLRGHHARSVHYAVATGRVFMRFLPREDLTIASKERQYAAGLEQESVGGTVDLF